MKQNKRLADRGAQRLALVEMIVSGGPEATRAAYLLIEEYGPLADFDAFVFKCFPKGVVTGASFDALADAWELSTIGKAIQAAPEVAEVAT